MTEKKPPKPAPKKGDEKLKQIAYKDRMLTADPRRQQPKPGYKTRDA